VNIALAPTTVSASAASTGPRVSTRSSARMSLTPVTGSDGSASRSDSIATAPTPAIPANAVRQPSTSPAQVASGTPPIVATVSPVNIAATAPARLSAGTRLAATTEPTPKNAPWLNEVTTRAIISVQYPSASADSALPSVKMPINATSNVRRSMRPVVSVISGAPISTPIA